MLILSSLLFEKLVIMRVLYGGKSTTYKDQITSVGSLLRFVLAWRDLGGVE